MEIFETVLYALRDGSKKYDLSPLPYKDKEITEHINNLITRWHQEIEPLILKASEDGIPEYINKYNSLIHTYVKEIDDFVNHLEQRYKDDLTMYKRLRVALLIVASAVFFLLMFYIKNKLVAPMKNLKDGVIAIGKGNFDVYIDVKTKDEIGILAAEINKMASELKKSYQEITKKNERLLKLYDIALSLDDDIEKICNKVTSTVAEIFGVKLVCLTLKRSDRKDIVSLYKDGEFINLKQYPETERDPKKIFSEYTIVHESSFLLDKDGELKYILSLMDESQKTLSKDDLEFIYTIGKKLILAMQRKKEEEEKKLLEAQLFQSQKMEAIGTLAAGIAHDFNNLLTGIMGHLELAFRLSSESEVKEQINKVINISEKAAELARQILLIGRKLPPDKKPTDLNQIVESSVKMLRRMVEENIEIKVHLQKNLPLAGADPSQLMQVIMNLVVNARDAMPDGGKIEIKTEKVSIDEQYCKHYTYAKPGDYVVVSVADTGTGIPEEIRNRIFGPFFTTKEQGKGTGLGLSVVYSIIKNHGGWINLYTEMGRGSEFKVYIPATYKKKDEVSEADKQKEATGLPKGTETILLVDDEEIIRELGESILRSLGYNVITASNGEEAIEIYNKEHNRGCPPNCVNC